MKKILSVLVCMGLALSLASCGCSKSKTPTVTAVDTISPDTLITVEDASAVAGAALLMSDDGITNDGTALSVTYVARDMGAADPVTVRIEQFSETLPTSQVWADYENSRLQRGDMAFIEGIGQDCFVAYPFINVYDRGCFIKISAGSGDSDAQRDMLVNLATKAVSVLETMVSAEAAGETDANVIK